MKQHTKDLEDEMQVYMDTEHTRESFEEQWRERVQERNQREALKAIMDKKEAEQRKQRDTLNKAAQFLQAHYRGMIARREMERARKGKKGKRRKK